MKIEKIYFDMDGVLADFNKGVVTLCGLPAPDQMVKDEERDNIMFDKIREIGHFYDKLEPIPGAVELFLELYGIYGDKVQILTGIPKPHRGIAEAESDKRAWVARILSPDVRVNTVLKSEKTNFCHGPASVLIDDYAKTVENWIDSGGIGIIHTDAKTTAIRLRELGIL